MILELAVQQENQPKPHQKLNQYIINYIKGYFSRKYLFLHVTAGTILIIACFVISGTLSTKFNIMTNSFSSLGSWDSWHNPRGWFVFSIGLVVSIFVVLPLIPFQHCRIKYVNRALSNLVSVSLYLGCLSFLMVAFFPVVSSSISGGKVTFSNVHVVSALSGFCIVRIWLLHVICPGYVRPVQEEDRLRPRVHLFNIYFGVVLHFSVAREFNLDIHLPFKVQRRFFNWRKQKRCLFLLFLQLLHVGEPGDLPHFCVFSNVTVYVTTEK
ncbi:Conserved_hypothetical protein [Hexamita inflata]|uniref:Uncharacterized protein n=1 Tax=Hexamita inflata TaxID=28002 RepID=A0AA86VU49_9EUKA|nr:Conserved hypothetical protein [Hexamita inflata]